MYISFLEQPLHENDRLGNAILRDLSGDKWTHFLLAVAFVKRSGTKHLMPALTTFLARGHVKAFVGIDHGGTSYEALSALQGLEDKGLELFIVHNRNAYTYHPKVYCFSNKSHARIYVGSGNLTEGGLFTNYEGTICIDIDRSNESEQAAYQSLVRLVSSWAVHPSGSEVKSNVSLLKRLNESGYLPYESEISVAPSVVREGVSESESEGLREVMELFGKSAPPPPPVAERMLGDEAKRATKKKTSRASSLSRATQSEFFVMTLQKTDVGTGQTTKGTARRSPEVFVPLAARDARKSFWRWDEGFEEDPNNRGKFDRRGVKVFLNGRVISLNMMTWPAKHDFRLRSEELRSAGEIGDIVKIERPSDSIGFEYRIEIVPKGSAEHALYLAKCTEKVRNSKRVWGYYTISLNGE